MSQVSPQFSDDRTIVIVGGVAGGASAAARARRCNEGASIIMFEKDRYVSFANCGLPYHVGEEIEEREKLIVTTPELFADRFNIDARPRHQVTSIDRANKTVLVKNLETEDVFVQAYDQLILAPGASPIVPSNLPAVENVFTLRNIEDMDQIKQTIDSGLLSGEMKRAVVVGAGFIGLEMVEQLDRRGIYVALVEKDEQVLPPLDFEMAKLIEQELKRHSIELHMGNGIRGIKTEGYRATGVELDNGEVVPADIVILGIGVRPNTELAKACDLELGEMGGIKVNEFMQTSDPSIYAVGDAVEYQHGVLDIAMRVALAGPANRAGRVAGEHAATGNSPAMGPVYGTAIVRVYELGAASTGLSEKLAKRMNRKAKAVIIQGGSHSGYFPGAKPLTLKLVYDPDNGRVLGAQAIGAAGIDKRIDVIATALRFQATVDDLTDLDLAYAPPYGSAKDPVHIAAFAAQNDLRGFSPIVPPNFDLVNKQIVDVRTPQEHEKLPPVGGAVNIEVDNLRDQLRELDPEKPTVVICHSAKRGHIAARILLGHGFSDVSNLTGGMSIRRLYDE